MMKATASLTGGLQSLEVSPLVHRSPSPLSSKPKTLPYRRTSPSSLKNPPLTVLEIDDLGKLFFLQRSHTALALKEDKD